MALGRMRILNIKKNKKKPWFEETSNQIRWANSFIKLDLRAAYHQIRIKEGGEWKTAFRTQYGLFEILVIPFGLTNAPVSAQIFMTDTLREYLNLFCVCYIDDIVIYSDTLEEHETQVKKVVTKLQEASLFIKPEKCEFSIQKQYS